MGENHFEAPTVATYAVLLNLCGIAYTILQRAITNCNVLSESMQKSMERQKRKGIISLSGYSLAIPFAFVYAAISGALFLLIAIMWLIPDKNIEKALNEK